jgi:hypothetical protein
MYALTRTSLLLSAITVFLSWQPVVAQDSDGWWLRPFRMLQTNLRAIDADMDVNQTLDFLEQHGANAWLLSVGGILANYPTELEFHAYNSLQAKGRQWRSHTRCP